MDVKYSNTCEAQSPVPEGVSTLHGAHIKDIVESGPNEKAALERNADSGYHTGSWSDTDCLSTTINEKKFSNQHNMESSNGCLSGQICVNTSSSYGEMTYTNGCISCGKEQSNNKVIQPQSSKGTCKHNVCNYNLHEQWRADVDGNGNMLSRTVSSHDFIGAHIERCGVTQSYVCMPLSASTTSIVQSTSCSTSLDYIQPSLLANHGVSTDSDVKADDKLESEAQDLALKIEFCLKFGYTATQIRAAISKLSYKATKNDIIKELFNFSAVENSPLVSKGQVTIVDQIPSQRKYNDLVVRGISPSSQDMYESRGPQSLENGTKQIPAKPQEDDTQNLRPIVIDGSNVAMSHGNKQYFSCKGILLAVDFFRMRNHRDITVFIPQYRKESPRPDAPIRDREILDELEQERILVYTPSRCINGKRVTCYDDRFILRLAEETDGVIVSNDNFRDLQNEKQKWKELIEKRLLMYSFVNDRFMPPDDPLGRNGPSIDNFLRKRPASEEQSKPQCPYGKKCTYGKKCKFFHPECSFSSVTEKLRNNSEKRLSVSKVAESLAAELVQQESQNPERNERSVGHSGSPSRGTINSKEESVDARNAPSNQVVVNYGTREQQQSRPAVHAANLSEYAIHRNNSYPYRQGHVGNPEVQPGSNPYPRSDGSLTNNLGRLHVSSPSPQGRSMPGSGSAGNNPYIQQYPNQRNPQQNHLRFGSGPPGLHMDDRHVIHPNMAQANVQAPYSTTPGYHVYDNRGGMMVAPNMNLPGHHYPHMPHPQYLQQPAMYAPPMMYDYHQQAARPPMMCCPPNPPPGVMQPFYVNQVSQGSGSSRSYGTVPTSEALSTGSVNSDDPKTFPPVRRSNKHEMYGQHPSTPIHNRSPQRSGGPDNLDNESNPRHNLFKNLCGLFPRVIVEKVMEENPEMREPKRLIKLCLGEEN